MNEDFDIVRLLLVYFVKGFIGVFFLFLAFKLVKRDKSRLTLNISTYFLTGSIALILNAIQIPLRIYDFSYAFYYIIIYLIAIAPAFLIFYELDLLDVKNRWSIRKQFIVFIIYSVVIVLILFFVQGITFQPADNIWIPFWSWELFLTLVLFISLGYIVPNFILCYLVIRRFKQNWLKKRLITLVVSNNGLLFILIGTALYNTWNNATYSYIWPFLAMSFIPLSIMLYYSIVHQS